MHRPLITPGKFSQANQTNRSQRADCDVTPNKKDLLGKQKKSIERLSLHPKGPSKRDLQDWEEEKQQYQQEINRLKAQNRRLSIQIQQIQKEDSNNKILEYEMYIVELNQQLEEQKEQFGGRYRELQERLRGLAEKEDQAGEEKRMSERYKQAIYESIIQVMHAFSCFVRVKNGNQELGKLEREFTKVYGVLEPFVEEFDIESDLQEAMKAEQKESTMTFPTNNDVFRSTFNKDMFQCDVSTNKSQLSFSSDLFSEGNSYSVRKEYTSPSDSHLGLREGDEVRILKKSQKGFWIGECGDNIGYFPEGVLL